MVQLTFQQKYFSNLINKQFTLHHWFHQVFNRNKFKVSWSYFKDIKSIINDHNQKIPNFNLIKKPVSLLKRLNCRDKNSFPINYCWNPYLNKKIVQLTHSELDIKHKKPLNKKNMQKWRGIWKDIWQIKKENNTLNTTWEPLKNIKYSVHREKTLPLSKRKTWDSFLQRMVFTQSIIRHYLKISVPKWT